MSCPVFWCYCRCFCFFFLRGFRVSGPCWIMASGLSVRIWERAPTGSSGSAAGRRLPARSKSGSLLLLGCRGSANNGSVFSGWGAEGSRAEIPVWSWLTMVFIIHVPICCQKDAIMVDRENPVLSPTVRLTSLSKKVLVNGPAPPHVWKASGWNTHPAVAQRVAYFVIFASSFRCRWR